jgi:hypothetical protein
LPEDWLSGLTEIILDYTGKYLAVPAVTGGVQLYHFNKGEPITIFGNPTIKRGTISRMRWDSAGHLFAQNGETGAMLVYEVTKIGMKELPRDGTVIPIGPNNYNVFPTFVVRAK